MLSLPGKRTVLVDAGFHSQGKGKFGGNDLVEQIIQDVTAISGKARIDVVIATHRHQDHICAFNSPKWEEVEIGEVWLPWVEDVQCRGCQNVEEEEGCVRAVVGCGLTYV